MSSSPDPRDVLASAWSEVFGSPATPEADFYALGGDSLTAVRIASIVGERLGALSDLDAFVMTELLDSGNYGKVETAMLEFIEDAATL